MSNHHDDATIAGAASPAPVDGLAAMPAPSGAGRRRKVRLVVFAAAAVLIDLASKVAAVTWLPAAAVDLPGPVDLRLGYNTGVAFSAGAALPAWTIITLTAVAALALVVAAWRGALPGTLGPALMVGGAAANVLDRLQGGSVVDMLHTGWWPTFNLADVALTVGAAATVLAGSRPPRDRGPAGGDSRPGPAPSD